MHTLTPLRLSRTLAALCFLPALVFGIAAFAQTPDKTVKTVKPVQSITKSKGVYRLPIPPKDFSPPLLVIGEPVHEWGSTVRGSVVKHTFKVTNGGGSPLIIDRVKPQCGCTAVDKPTQPIPPGGSASLTLSIDTKRFKGPMKKTAKIHSNATTEPYTVTMQGSVEQVFVTDPENPKFEVVRGSEVNSGKITLRRSTQKPARVLEVTTAGSLIKPVLKEIEPGTLYEIDVGIELAASKRNYFYENLVTKIESDGQVIDLPLRVTIIVKDRIDVSPKSAYFPRKATDTLKVPNAPGLTKELTIKSLGGPEHSFHITEIVNPGVNFTTKVDEIEPGRHYKLTVSLPRLPEQKGRTVRDRLTIKTDDDKQPEIVVTAMGIFSGPATASSAAKRLRLPRTVTPPKK